VKDYTEMIILKLFRCFISAAERLLKLLQSNYFGDNEHVGD